MKTIEILENINKIDKNILEIYNKIKEKEIHESINQEKLELKNLSKLEDYLYSILNRKEIKNIINQYKSSFDEELYYKLSLEQSQNIIQKKNKSNELNEKLVTKRIINYLDYLYKIEVNDSKMDDKFIDDKTKIYLPDNIKENISLTEEEYINKIKIKEEKVYAFYEKTRRELIFNSLLDKDLSEIFFLYLRLETTNYPQFYLNEIYNNIFINKLLENKMLLFDFNMDKLLKDLNIEETTPNKKFISWYRSHNAFLYLEKMIKKIKQYSDDIILSNLYLIYNLSYDMFLLAIDANLMLLNENDFQELKKEIEQYLKTYNKSEIVKESLYKKISQENYQKLKKIINL